MINVNIGLLGHVDSGKTSLAKAISQTASTAAFDKSPQSQSRGITLDLGFSAREISSSEDAFRSALTQAGVDRVMCTFVDCPGHASLIRTVLGGAHIIDVMVLVIDAAKGVQPQTAECIVLGEVLAKPLLVVINKIDTIQGATPQERQDNILRLKQKLSATFSRTRWPVVSMVEVAAAPRAADHASIAPPIGTDKVLPALLPLIHFRELKRRLSCDEAERSPFVMFVDHCFAVRGQGTVFTGTVVDGVVSVGDSVFLPEQRVAKKIKGLQVFRKPVEKVRRGDRVGLCVSQFDPSLMERGVITSVPGVTSTAASASIVVRPSFTHAQVLIAEVHRVRFHPYPCDQQTRFHVSLGHVTVMGTMRFFSRPARATRRASAADAGEAATSTAEPFDAAQESNYVEALEDDACLLFEKPSAVVADAAATPGLPAAIKHTSEVYFAILLLEHPVFTSVGQTLIAMRLDLEKENFCRIAVAGEVKAVYPLQSTSGQPSHLSQKGTHNTGESAAWRHLPVVRLKHKTLIVDRVIDSTTCVASGLFAGSGTALGDAAHPDKEKVKQPMHAEVRKFIGLKVVFHPSEDEAATRAASVEGVIDSAFGKTGKVKLKFSEPIFVGVTTGKLKHDGTSAASGIFTHPGEIVLTLKKYPLAAYSPLQQ